MSLHKEISFEVEICQHLAGHGWLYADKDAADYDRQLALFPADVLAWVQATQPAAWEALTKNHGASAGDTLLRRLRQSIDQQGTLHVLRQAHGQRIVRHILHYDQSLLQDGVKDMIRVVDLMDDMEAFLVDY